MTKNEFLALEKKFNALSAKKQWKWILDNKKIIHSIALDNDQTQILFEIEDSRDEDEDLMSICPFADLGWRDGAVVLLNLLGFKAECV